MKREMNKKAQGLETSTLILILLGIALLVFIGMALLGVFGPIFSGFKLAPSGLTTFVTACDGYAKISSQTDFCQFRQITIDGKTEYINCVDPRVTNNPDFASKGFTDCASNPPRTGCINLIKSGEKTPKINNVDCINVFSTSLPTCSEYSGKLVISTGSCPPTSANLVSGITYSPEDASKTRTIPSTYLNAKENTQICCVAP